jgi:hypothetical protein
MQEDKQSKQSAFEASGEGKESSLLGEFCALLKHNRKYWLIPLVLILLVFGVLIILGSTGAAPFIYTLF